MKNTTLFTAILSLASFVGIQESQAVYTITCPDKPTIGEEEVTGNAVVSTGGKIQVKTHSMEVNPKDVIKIKLDQALVKGLTTGGNSLVCRYNTWQNEKVGNTYELIASLGKRDCKQTATIHHTNYIECE